MPRIESLLSARLFLSPQLVGERLYFMSNLSGRLSLYVMDHGGSVPEPLLPPQIALQNPELLGGYGYYVFPQMQRIVLMLDKDGDESYQPMTIPIDGGIPEPAFGDHFLNYRTHLWQCDPKTNYLYLSAESRLESLCETYRANLETGALQQLSRGQWGSFVADADGSHRRALLVESYTVGDHALYLWSQGEGQRRLLYGTPLEERVEGQQVPLTGFGACCFTANDRGLLCITSLFSDTFGLGYLPLDRREELRSVEIIGAVHGGAGELVSLEKLQGDRYLVGYNVDGCSWLYEGAFDVATLGMTLEHVLCGIGTLADGVVESVQYDTGGDRFALAFSTATSPVQLYTLSGAKREQLVQQTHERVLGIPSSSLAPGEDASFRSFDGQRISARLYLPAASLEFSGPRPLVYYIHGGPQSQERPDFAWFSMPLIQFLTLQGFAVFVPNVRGSTGYGLSYTKQVDRDWGGNDRLDHLQAMDWLRWDERIDVHRAAVMGRSYGGFMTLTLASRHPELWSAAIDLFGPYDLLQFMDKIPETWKPYFVIAVGDPLKDRDLLIERSPCTHIEQLACPLLVIQGQNDPRVVEPESRALVERLRGLGKSVEYLLFDNEGHDVLKFENRVSCYNAIAVFLSQHLLL